MTDFVSTAELIYHMPHEELILGAVAQVSRNKGDILDPAFYRDGVIDKEGERKTLRFCVKSGHLSVLEFAQFVFKVRCPIFVARQLMRYRNASYIERSLRYCVPETREWAKEIEDPETAGSPWGTMVQHEEYCRSVYNDFVCEGIKKEWARGVLPLSTMTVFLMRIDLREALHIFDERLTPQCQKETREVVEQMYEEVKRRFPLVIGEYESKKNNDA